MGLKEKFFEEMNKHGNTNYKTVGGEYIIELQRFSSRRKGILKIWREEDEQDDSFDGWVRVVHRYGDYSEMYQVYNSLDTKRNITEQVDKHTSKRTA